MKMPMKRTIRRPAELFLIDAAIVIAILALLTQIASTHAQAATPRTSTVAQAWGLWQPANNSAYKLKGQPPPVAISYYGWQEQPQCAEIQDAAARHTTGYLVIGSEQTDLATIVTGRWDAYLTSFGQNIANCGVPVLATFDHEMNGSWYPWGEQATAWRAAWNHVTDTINAGCNCGSLLRWVWAPNVTGPGIDSPALYWPVRNVDMIGIDGYFWTPQDRFGAVFGQTVRIIRKHWPTLPMVIAEAGVEHSSPDRIAQVRSLACHGYSVWYFDAQDASGIDWHLGPYEHRAFLRCQRWQPWPRIGPESPAPAPKVPSDLRIFGNSSKLPR